MTWQSRVVRVLLVVAIVLLLMIISLAFSFQISPWPGVILGRAVINAFGQKNFQPPPSPTHAVTSLLDIRYGETSSSYTRLDVYYPSGTTEGLCTVLWIHGGVWISGDKDNYRDYYQLLASRGFTVVSMNYGYGPETIYPTALHQLNSAHAYLLAHAADLKVDPSRLVLAGDSAGAQIASQMINLINKPDYASSLGIKPALSPRQLQGTILHCGVYEMSTLLHARGLVA